MPAIVKCPTCKREVEWSPASLYRPFCSDRCRLVDMGAWLSEQHRIPDESDGTEDRSQPGSAEEP
jgi:endogenous inhibitor of DNA gyrase (YacG/DUF329 family)